MTSSNTARSVLRSTSPCDRVLVQPQPAVAGHRLGDVDQQRVRHRRSGCSVSSASTTCSASCPAARAFHSPERRQPVGVDVLRRALQLGERRDRLAGVRAWGWSTSSSRVLSDWTIRGPSFTC